jgi:Replication initiator protein, pSAM2
MPDGTIYEPCGNRRAATCPGWAETYRRDAYQLIRAGLIGGKGITPAVTTHLRACRHARLRLVLPGGRNWVRTSDPSLVRRVLYH